MSRLTSSLNAKAETRNLKLSYTLLAPLYDFAVGPLLRRTRQASLARLPQQSGLELAIVPKPVLALQETARVLKPGGRVLVLDKFLRPGQSAPLRRVLSPLVGRVATRLDVVFEEALAQVTGLKLVSDEPALARGWLRSIELLKIW